MNFSIHTFEITYYNCSPTNYIQLHHAITKLNTTLCPRKEKPCNTYGLTNITHTYTCLNRRGINRIQFRRLYDKLNNQALLYGIKFVINPRILLECKEHPYTEIIEPEDLPHIPEALNSILQELSPGFPDISEYGILTRIDYCTNLWFQTAEEADEYFRLLKKYYTPAKFCTDTFYNSKKHRKSSRKGEISLSCQSYTFTIYQKQTQLLQSEYNYPPEEIENACGQLRIELRLKRKKIYALKKAFSSYESELFTQIPPSVFSILIKKLSVMYGKGNFFRLSNARQQIYSSDYTKKTQASMIEILENVNEKRTLDCYNTDFRKKTLKTHRKKFNDLEISPITLPLRSIHETYPNLILYITGKADDYLRK